MGRPGRIRQAAATGLGKRFALVVEPELGGIHVVGVDQALVDAVRRPQAPRAAVVLDLAEPLIAERESFRGWATGGQGPTERKAGRPRKRRADLRSVGGGA